MSQPCTYSSLGDSRAQLLLSTKMSRKRDYSDYESDNYGSNGGSHYHDSHSTGHRGRGGNGGGYGRRGQGDSYGSYQDRRVRHRNDNQDNLHKIKSAIIEIGEPARKYRAGSMIINLAESFERRGEELKHALWATMKAVVIEQPHKIPLLAASVEIASNKSEFGQIVIDFVKAEIEKCLEQGSYKVLKPFLRLLATLENLLHDGVVSDLLLQLLDAASVSTHSGTKEQVFLAVALAVPFLRSSSSKETLHKEIVSFEIDSSGNPADLQFYGENVPYVPRTFVYYVKAAYGNQPIEESAQCVLQYNDLVQQVNQGAPIKKVVFGSSTDASSATETINLPETLPEPWTKDLQTYLFEAYRPSSDGVQTLPDPDTYFGIVLRDVAQDICSNLDFNRKEVARQLLILDLFFPPLSFAEPGVQFDLLKELKKSGKPTWKVEDAALDTTLNGLFALPKSKHISLFYHVVLFEACSMAPQAVAPVFGRAIRFLYANLETLDTQLFYTFLDWMSHHLSNFDFNWKWEEWSPDVKLDKLHPKRVFIEQLLLKEVRLSQPKRIKSLLPSDELAALIPDVPEESLFKFGDESEEFYDQVQALLLAFRGSDKEKHTEAFEALRDAINEKGVGASVEISESALSEAVIQTLCEVGNRSMSHNAKAVARCSHVLKELSDKKQIITTILDYWKGEPQRAMLVALSLVSEGVIEDSFLGEYIVNSGDLLVTAHGWETLRSILDNNHGLTDTVVESVKSVWGSLEDEPWKIWWSERIVKVLERTKSLWKVVEDEEERESERLRVAEEAEKVKQAEYAEKRRLERLKWEAAEEERKQEAKRMEEKKNQEQKAEEDAQMQVEGENNEKNLDDKPVSEPVSEPVGTDAETTQPAEERTDATNLPEESNDGAS